MLNLSAVTRPKGLFRAKYVEFIPYDRVFPFSLHLLLLYRFDDKKIHSRYILANFLVPLLPNLHVIIQF